MGVVYKPTKSMLIAVAEEVEEVTFKVTLLECVSEPLVPVMLSVEFPGVGPVSIVSVELPEPVIVVGEKDDDAPNGKPAAAKFTVAENPFSAVTFTV